MECPCYDVGPTTTLYAKECDPAGLIINRAASVVENKIKNR